jgi:TolB-like protein/Tfp pilus assembly protein PilF
MPDIFLSYTREDQATAQRFAEAFEAQGLSVWWDATLRSGEAYDQITEEALRTAKAVVVLWSRKSAVSRWVRAEATLADRSRTLVPARIEACDLPIMFELTQTADLSHWTGAAGDPAWRAFLADVRRFVEIGRAPRPAAPRPSAPAAPPRSQSSPSIAVLPFINRSGREEDDVFADAIVEDLVAELPSPWLNVVAASATAVYRKGARDLRQIGRDLGVRCLLEGNVRRVGEDLRVTAQLVEAETGKILWTQKFDRPLAELSTLQEDLVAEVAARLRGQVERAEMEHALQKTGYGSAFEAIMRAAAYSIRSTRSGWEAAVAELKRAVEADPNYGAAYAELASAQVRLSIQQGGDDPELVQEILGNVRRACALDPDNPIALGSVAAALSGLGKLQDALPFAERALALSPNVAQSHLILGGVLLRLGRLDEAITELDASDRLADAWLDHSMNLRSIAHLRAGRLDHALDAAEKALRFRPSPEPLIQGMLCLAKLNRWDDARHALHRLRDTDFETSLARVETVVRDLYCGSDDVDEYVAIARKIWDEASGEARPA